MNTIRSLLTSSILFALLLWIAAPGCAQSPAQRFKGNPLYDPDFVPIGVGSQNLTNAPIYHDAGINLIVGIDDITENPTLPKERKPTAETLKILSDLGMYAIVNQATWIHQIHNPTIVAWVCTVDEPDNQQADGKPMPLEKFLSEAAKAKRSDPTRPFTTCFGQGVINDGFTGRALPRSEYPSYMAAVDFIQYDFYPIANFKWRRDRGFTFPSPSNEEPWRTDGANYLDMVGQGVTRIRQWTHNKPVMAWIETSHNHNPNPHQISTPAQTACEVWDAMVHGARGVSYFSHDFTLPESMGQAATLSRNKPKLAYLKITHAKLQKLARVISAPMATEADDAPSHGGHVVFSTKIVAGSTVVLSVNVLDETARASIPVKGLKKGAKIAALEENRTLEADADGSFTDTFAPYQEHIYKILPD